MQYLQTESLSLPCRPGDADAFLSTPPESVIASLRRLSGNFLVLGAGGKMGLHLCLMLRRSLDLLGSPAKVTAVSRFHSDRQPFQKAGIATIPCDLCNPAEIERLDHADNVIFMAGAKFGTSGQPDLLHKMNVEMPELVASHFAQSRVTAFSTGCVYSFAPVDSAGSTESSGTDPIGAYARSCLGREAAFRRSSLTFGTQLAIIRLNYSVEFRYGVLVDIARKVLHDEPIDLTMGHVNLIWQRDAVAHSLLAHELASTTPFIINITGPGVHRVRDLAMRFGAIFDRSPRFVGTESPTAWLNDSSRASRLFGKPETSLEQMISWVAAWQANGHETLDKPTGFEKRDGNF